MMRKLFVAFFTVSAILIITGFKIVIKDAPVVKPEELKGWIDYLASDAMRGRANGSPEMAQAAGWLSDRFKDSGLNPLLPGGFIQEYSYTSRQKTVNERNVIGILEGNDPLLKDQYLILTSHFDHVGVRKGNDADSIYNGADDNAAGTCTILGIAKTIKESGLKPGRSIIFASFSGEENGMRGSRYFVANTPVPLEKIYANVNFEMTGHSEYLGKNHYYMTGCKISELDNIIGEFNKSSGWTLIDTIALAESLFNSSDNISFSRAKSADGINSGIPSGTFATTALAKYIHSPYDEGKLFDYENMAGLVKYFSDLTVWLSKNKSEIGFTSPKYVKLK
jgi:Zn-dependent M28 family amino/carboxypeptidase